LALLKQSTAYTATFLMIDSTDHISAKTGLTVTVNISKAGAAFGAAGGTVTEIANGWYKIVLTTTDTNTVGDLSYHCTATGADATDFKDQVFARIIDDLAFPATSGRSMVVDAAGLVDANAVKLGPTGAGTAQTARDIGASVLLSAGAGAGQLDFTSGVVKANATQWLGGTIPAVNVTGVPLVDLKYTLGTISPATAGSVRADAVTGAVGSVTGNVGGSVASVTAAVTLTAKDSFVVRNATAQAGAASTITLDASASATDNFYNGEEIKLDSGTGAGQTRTILSYVGSTKVATLDRAWATNPDNTSVFTIFNSSAPRVDSNLAVTTGTNSDKTGYALTAAYDPAKTAAQAGDIMKVSSGTGANQVSLAAGLVTVGTNNDKTGYSIAAGGIGSGAHAAAELNNIADGLLDRNMATGTIPARTQPQYELRAKRCVLPETRYP
jgi:hypothetical protein